MCAILLSISCASIASGPCARCATPSRSTATSNSPAFMYTQSSAASKSSSSSSSSSPPPHAPTLSSSSSSSSAPSSKCSSSGWRTRRNSSRSTPPAAASSGPSAAASPSTPSSSRNAACPPRVRRQPALRARAARAAARVRGRAFSLSSAGAAAAVPRSRGAELRRASPPRPRASGASRFALRAAGAASLDVLLVVLELVEALLELAHPRGAVDAVLLLGDVRRDRLDLRPRALEATPMPPVSRCSGMSHAAGRSHRRTPPRRRARARRLARRAVLRVAEAAARSGDEGQAGRSSAARDRSTRGPSRRRASADTSPARAPGESARRGSGCSTARHAPGIRAWSLLLARRAVRRRTDPPRGRSCARKPGNLRAVCARARETPSRAVRKGGHHAKATATGEIKYLIFGILMKLLAIEMPGRGLCSLALGCVAGHLHRRAGPITRDGRLRATAPLGRDDRGRARRGS